MWIITPPSSTIRRASAAYSSGVYGIAGHWSRLAMAPEIELLMITGSSKRLIRPPPCLRRRRRSSDRPLNRVGQLLERDALVVARLDGELDPVGVALLGIAEGVELS